MYNFDYFYGNEAEQYQFYMIPQLLFTDDKFRKLSSDAKILYGLLLDRSGLSFKNKDVFTDENGRTFIYFKQETAMQMLNCAKDKIIKTFKELENIGLIEKKRQGLGKPTKIYVKHFNRLLGEAFNPRKTGIFSEVGKTDIKKSEKPTSESRKNRLQEVGKTDTNHTNINQTNINQTELSQSIYLPTAETEQIDRLIDRKSKHKMTFPEILEAIGYSDDCCYEESKENDYSCFDEELRRTQECEIPYSFVENKNDMIQSLKFLFAYSYHIENDGFDKTEITFFNTVISSLAEITTQKTIKVSGKTVKYHEIIDKLNSVISTSYLYDWYVEFKQHWENILAEKDRNNEKIKNLPIYLNSCIANYIMSYGVYGTADEMSANGFIRQWDTSTDKSDRIPDKDIDIPISTSNGTGNLPLETKISNKNVSDEKPKEDTAKAASDITSAPDMEKLNEDVAAFMARLRGETLEQEKERQEQEEKNKQARIKNAKYFKELFEERGEPFPMWLTEQLKELEIP